MCPTRELALQVAEEFAALAKHRDLSVVAVYGGASMGEQLDKLEAGAEIVVGTPGRIYDHIRRKTLKLDEAMVCCLDEADEMLNMGVLRGGDADPRPPARRRASSSCSRRRSPRTSSRSSTST